MSNSRNKPPASSLTADAGASLIEELPVTRNDRGSIEDQIRMRAYELYLERGSKPSDDLGDWLRAEREYVEQPKLAAEESGDHTTFVSDSPARN